MPFALFDELPELERRVQYVALGTFPTPVQSLSALARELGAGRAEGWVKRDDISASVYGGNKVRTLELLFGDARARGYRRVLATGAFGSNHALATALHAPLAGLEPEALLFPQPVSAAARTNLSALTLTRAKLYALPHWSALPLAMAWLGRAQHAPYVMVPGGATALGALGYVSAGLELAQQITRHELPAPRRVIVGVGSTCTSAGLLVGLALAGHFGRAFSFAERPTLSSVRVSPWPVTSRFRILSLAVRASRLLHALSDGKLPLFTRAALGARFEVDGSYLGSGYGVPSSAGNQAEALWRSLGLNALDSTYSAKSAARLVSELRANQPGPVLFWSTKSSVPLPAPDTAHRHAPPPGIQRWLSKAQRVLGP